MILALDIGGTNLRSALVSNSKISKKKSSSTPKKKGNILKSIISTIEQYKKPNSINIAIAGFERNGKLQHSINLDTEGLQLSKILKQKFKVPIYIENDANCAGLAELHYGSGKGKRNFVLLTLGTGIGGAIIINKKLYRGAGGAGEIGSMYINNKIFEHHASGNASLTLAREIISPKITSLELEELANQGNKRALDIYNEIGHFLGIGLANIAFFLDPEAIILGGGFSRVKHIHAPAKHTFNKLYNITPKPKVLRAKLGVDAGLIGAGLLSKYR
jgi:glucokinase